MINKSNIRLIIYASTLEVVVLLSIGCQRLYPRLLNSEQTTTTISLAEPETKIILKNEQTSKDFSLTGLISLTELETNSIIEILKDGSEGIYSNLEIGNAYLSIFIESADYGPMWYGDTIEVNQTGYLIQYEYRRDKDNLESSETIFIPNDKSAIYRKYTCQFGDIPPSHGFSNRRWEWNNKFEKILSILNKN